MKHWRQIADGLFRLTGRIGGYLVAADGKALVVDPPDCPWADALAEVGLSKVDWILATHFHRDTLAGAAWLKRFAELLVPAEEDRLVSGAGEFWQRARTYILYDCSSKFFCLREPVQSDRLVRPGQTLRLGPWQVRVLPLRGHTEGHCGYLVNVGGRRVAFVGDAMCSPGTVHNWYDFHWGYMDFNRGHRALLEDLEHLERAECDLICPAHGEPTDAATEALRLLRANLQKFISAVEPNRLPRQHDEFKRISPHIWFVGQTCYAIVADDGACLLWDVGYPADMRARLNRLRTEASVKRIEAIAFSHYHDDHTWRAMEAAYGFTGTSHEQPRAELWAHEVLVDVLTRPHAYRLPCLLPIPLRIDRVFNDEPFDFHGIPMRYIFLPGQTYWHAGLIVDVDGMRVAFTGDNIWHPADRSRSFNGPVISRNRYLPGMGFDYSGRRLADLQVDLICPAHGEPFRVNEDDWRRFIEWADSVGDAIRNLAGSDRLGVDPWWCRIDPFHIYAAPGEVHEIRVVIESPFDEPVRIAVSLRLPGGFEASAMRREVYVEPGCAETVTFALRIPQNWNRQQVPLTADLVVNGQYWPEQAEALVIPREPFKGL